MNTTCTQTIAIFLLLIVAMPLVQAGNPCGDLNNTPNGKVLSLDQRVKYATQLRQANRELDRVIPRLSPEEAKWLRAETNASRPSAYFTVEYRKQTAARYTEERERLLLELLQLSKPGEPLRAQMILWAQVAWSYSEVDFANAITRLTEHHVIQPLFPRRNTFSSESDEINLQHEIIDTTCRSQAGFILGYIITPYLSYQLSE
jgi:hypothetical protein